jgi:hypothetical protein
VPRGDEHGVVVADRPQAPADCLKRQFWCSKSAHRPIYAPYFQAFHLHFKQLPWFDPKKDVTLCGAFLTIQSVNLVESPESSEKLGKANPPFGI